ncbi:MAG: hypothetical protein OK454_07560 [Thaumarchaeota archaeon]|nr:hypothetical protein [Nitrososphaerota archaeon]
MARKLYRSPKLVGNEILFRSVADRKAISELLLGPAKYLDYLDAYREGAKALYRRAARRKRVDRGTYLPIAYLWRHYLEITMKSILDRLCGDDDSKRQLVWDKHDLERLWARVSKAFEGIWPFYEPGEHARARALILQFHTLDRLSFGFRYPVNKDGTTPTLAADLRSIDLVDLHRGMCKLSEILERALDATDDWDERLTNGLATPRGIV